MVTVTFSSVAIGVGIDDSIHLIIRYRRQIRIYSGKVDKAVVLAHTLKTTGRPAARESPPIPQPSSAGGAFPACL